MGDADTPIAANARPLLTLDASEHIDYIDYRDRRPDFIKGYWNIVNWDFAAAN